MADESKALQLVNWITDRAIEGVPPLSPAKMLAMEYQIDKSYATDEDRIAALINNESKKSFTAGFITGLGGLLTLPVAIPSALAAAWMLQARLAAAIATILGHDVASPETRTLVVLSLLGDSAAGVVKDLELELGKRIGLTALTRLPARVLVEINRRVGMRLLTRLGGRSALTLSRALPIFGGVITGGFDAYACRKTGQTAKELFTKKPPPKKGRKSASVSGT